MGIPSSKTTLQEAIHHSYEKLDSVLRSIPEDLVEEKSMEGHAKETLMSPADLVSYLIGWNELVLKWLSRDDRGQDVDFPEAGYKWNELGLLAQKFYDDYKTLTFGQKREKLTNVQQRLVDDISKRSDDELYGQPWYGKWTKGRMIQLNSSSPYKNAYARLRKWLKQKDKQISFD